MKKYLFTCIYIILSYSGICFSQSGWIYQNIGPTGDIYSVYFIDLNTGFCSSGALYKTTNGGINWIVKYTHTDYIKKIEFPGSDTGYCISRTTILKSINAGETWNIILNDNMFNLYSESFINSLTGFAAGAYRIGSDQKVFILKTTDGGQNWLQYIDIYGFLRDIAFFNNNMGFAIGNNGYMSFSYLTSNCGLNWILDYGGVVGRDICVLDTNTGFLLNGSRIYKTINAGLNWYLISNYNVNDSYTHIYFMNSFTGFKIGTDNMAIYARIIKTTNGGLTWNQQLENNQDKIYRDIFFVNDTIGYLVGNDWDYGVVLKTTNGGEPVSVKTTNENIPSSFSLSQNYPNPFNPVTRIKYDVSKSSLVKIIIYDVLGREIETLVNETQKPGSYEVTWDGSRYGSGVYFYKLVTNNYVETKKMVLIK